MLKGNSEMTHFYTVNLLFIDTLTLPPNFLIRISQFIALLWSLEIKEE